MCHAILAIGDIQTVPLNKTDISSVYVLNSLYLICLLLIKVYVYNNNIGCELLLITMVQLHVFVFFQTISLSIFAHFSTTPYVVSTQKNRLNEAVLLSTQNTFLSGWIRLESQFYGEIVGSSV